jgi:hypothetical protein
MTKRLTRISPWQTAKTLAAFYFAIALIVGIPLGLLIQLAPEMPGQEKPGIMIFLALPFLYGIAALIFVPLACWLYNFVANMMGGVEFTTVETAPNA